MNETDRQTNLNSKPPVAPFGINNQASTVTNSFNAFVSQINNMKLPFRNLGIVTNNNNMTRDSNDNNQASNIDIPDNASS